MKKQIVQFGASLLLASFVGKFSIMQPAYAQSPEKFPVVELNAGLHVIKAEVAATDRQRQQGLMYRQSLGDNQGMLFVYEAPAYVCMWMKNTAVPLSVAFLDEKGVIINIEDMKPQTTESHCGKRSARYALEMKRGWFKQRKIRPGSTISGLEKLR